MRYGALIAYYLIYFVSTGLSSFLSKYYAEIGMSDGKIGMLMSVPTFNPPPSTYSGQTIRMNFKVNNGSYEISIY